MVRIKHKRHGLLTEDGRDIACYVHERHSIGECQWCDFVRVENITKEFLARMELVGNVNHLYMWSLGSSLTDTETNRKVMDRRWSLFRKRMNHVEKWSPVFRIIEVGRRGFLHYHVVATRFCEHRVVLNAWRSLTKEKSNVHVSGYRGNLEPRRLARYLMKYLSKESTSYRWLGEFYGLGRETSRNVSNVAVKPILIYGGEVYGGFESLAYEESRAQKSINLDDAL